MLLKNSNSTSAALASRPNHMISIVCSSLCKIICLKIEKGNILNIYIKKTLSIYVVKPITDILQFLQLPSLCII